MCMTARPTIATHLGRLCVGVLVLSPFLCLMPLTGHRRGCQIFRRDLMYFTRNDQGLNFFQTEGDWINDPTEVGLPADTPFYCATTWARWRNEWFGVQETFDHTLNFQTQNGIADPSTFTQSELDAIYARYAAHLKRVGFEQRTANLFLRGPGVATRIDWDAAGATLIAITLSLTVLYGTGWVVSSGLAESFNRPDPNIDPETGEYIRCPACNYDLAGLTTDICPECGRHSRSYPPPHEKTRP